MLSVIINVISSDFFSNIISLLELICTFVALVIGMEKVSELIREHSKRKRQAIFSYHINLKIYIRRLKKLLSDSNNNPLKTLYFFSADERIRNEAKGYERLAEDLYDLSKDFLNYLSSKPEQIPAVTSQDIKNWDALIEELVEYLTDFVLYQSGVSLPNMNTKEKIKKYHKDVLENFNQITKMINKLEDDYIDELNKEKM